MVWSAYYRLTHELSHLHTCSALSRIMPVRTRTEHERVVDGGFNMWVVSERTNPEMLNTVLYFIVKPVAPNKHK